MKREEQNSGLLGPFLQDLSGPLHPIRVGVLEQPGPPGGPAHGAFESLLTPWNMNSITSWLLTQVGCLQAEAGNMALETPVPFSSHRVL